MKKLGLIIMVIGMFPIISLADSYEDLYDEMKKNPVMEAKRIPPKVASLMIDKDDYPEAVDVLSSMNSLKYLNYYGEKEKANSFYKKSLNHGGDYKKLGVHEDFYRTVTLFGIYKKGFVKKIVAVVQKQREFFLVIGKGKLSDKQIELFPMLVKEI